MEFQRACDRASAIFQELQNRGTSGVQNVAELESYLRTLGLEIPFSFALGKRFVDANGADGLHYIDDLDYSCCAWGQIEEEALTWRKHSGHDYHLIYERSCWYGYVVADVASGPIICDETTLSRDTAPLAETALDVRERMCGHLPNFLKALASRVERNGRVAR